MGYGIALVPGQFDVIDGPMSENTKRENPTSLRL